MPSPEKVRPGAAPWGMRRAAFAAAAAARAALDASVGAAAARAALGTHAALLRARAGAAAMVYATAPGTRALNLWDGAGLARTQARRHGAVFPLEYDWPITDFGGQKPGLVDFVLCSFRLLPMPYTTFGVCSQVSSRAPAPPWWPSGRQENRHIFLDSSAGGLLISFRSSNANPRTRFDLAHRRAPHFTNSCEQQQGASMVATRPPRPAPASDIDPGPESSRVSVRL